MKFPELKENECYVMIYSDISAVFISIQEIGKETRPTSKLQYTVPSSLIDEIKLRMECLATWYKSMRSFGYNIEPKPFEVRLFQKGRRPNIEHFECIPRTPIGVKV